MTRLLVSALLLATGLFMPTAHAQTAAERRLQPVVVHARQAGISPLLRDLPPAVGKPAGVAERDIEIHRVRPMERIKPEAPRRDPVLQDSPPSAAQAFALPSLGLNFEGISNADNAAEFGVLVVPPDTNGDIGGYQYVQAANLLIQVFSKATGEPLLPPPPATPRPGRISSLFAGFGGPCETTDDGDSIALYDHLANRWLISQFTETGPPYHQCIAISQTDDATGAYYTYDFTMPNSKFNDYPKFGVWPDAYYMTDNQFTGNTWAGAGVFAFDRAKMLAGDPTASYVYFDLATLDSSIGGMLPADLDGPPPPLGTPGYFAYFTATEFSDAQDGLRLFKFHVDFATPANSTFTERAESPVVTASFDPLLSCGASGLDCIAQPAPANSNAKLDALADRLMFRLQYRNFGTYESLVTNHTVDANGSSLAGVRYYQLRRSLPGGNFAVAEQATYAPDSTNRWMASAAMDRQGDLAVGFSVSSSSVFPAIRYAGRLATDPAGGLYQGETTMQASTGSQTTRYSRWGDYSMLSVDPQDDCTFWYTSEYYVTSSDRGWQTRVGNFKFAQCTPLPSWTPTITPIPASTATPTLTATITATLSPSSTFTGTRTPTVTLTPTTTSTPSNTATATNTPSISPTRTASPSATPSSSPTATSSPTSTATTPPTATPSGSPTVTSTATITATPSITPSITPTASATITSTPSHTPTQTTTPSSSPTASWTSTPLPSATYTATLSPSPSASQTGTPSFTATRTATVTATLTDTPSNTPTRTATPSSSPTASWTSTPLPSATHTPTLTPTASASQTGTPSFTATRTPTGTATLTQTPSNTPTPTATPSSSRTSSPTSTAPPSATLTLTASPTNSATPTSTPPPSTTPTITSTPTQTNTPTITPPVFNVSGQMRYFTSASPVANVTLDISGVTPTSVSSDSLGQFSQGLDANANWQIKPHKNGDRFTAITAFDATLVLQAVTGSATLTSLQRLACDTNGSGGLTAFDASQILQFKVGLITNFIAATNCQSDWLFQPNAAAVANQVVTPVQLTTGNCQMGAIDYAPLAGPAASQDFDAILIGDCNGSWAAPAGGGGALAPAVAVRFGKALSHGGRMTVPLIYQSKRPYSSLTIDIAYDASAGRALGVRRTAATRDAMVVANTTEPGRLRIAMADTKPLPGRAELLLLRFESNSPLGMQRSLRAHHLTD